jgi:NADH:ubiquinone oxidoreductase subunit 6 (subunit J)
VFDEGVAFFSSAEVSISRNSFWSMFMLMLCFMSAAALYCVYLVYKIASRGEKQ